MRRRFKLRRRRKLLLEQYERKFYELLSELQIPLIMLNIAIFIGTIGYMILSDGDFINSFYMTIITLGTIGYGEVVKGSDTLAGRIFTSFLSLMGIGIFTTSITVIVRVFFKEDIVETYRKMSILRSIENLKDHYIICGYDEVSRWIVKMLRRRGIESVVVEPDTSKEDAMKADGIKHYILHSPYRDEVLYAAGIRRAKGMVVNIYNDAETIAIVSSARVLRKDRNFMIITLASEEMFVEKLYQIGATRVVDREQILASRVVAYITHPESMNISSIFDKILFGEEEDIDIMEVYVHENSPFKNRTLKELELARRYSITVIGIKRKDGKLIVGVRGDTKINEGDTLIIFGKTKHTEKFRKELKV